MKKITLLLLSFFFAIAGYSQTEGFESTSGPDALPSTNWTLGTGNWAVFDNGVGTNVRWGITTVASQVYNGVNSAYCNRENIGDGNTSIDYLATPLRTIPANGQLKFFTRTFQIGNQGTIYQIKVAPSSASQTDPNAYTLVQQWTDADIVTTFNVYEEKTVDLSAYAGSDVYIAFVMINNQTNGVTNLDRWLVDDVRLVEQCFDPTNLSANNISQTSADLSWSSPGTATQWEIEILPAAGTPTGTGTLVSSTTYAATATQPAGVAFTPTTAYKFYVRSICSSSVSSAWVGPFNFTTSSPGLSCSAPIQVTTLPYSTTDNTANYADNYDTAQPATCAGGATNYMGGNDVFYSYTPTTDETIKVTLAPTTAANTSVYIYDGCANLTVACLGGAADNTNNVRNVSVALTAGHQYIIVVSSTTASQTYAYTLNIQRVNCLEPNNLTAIAGIDTATLSWGNPSGATSWEIDVNTASTPAPSGSGTTVTSTTYNATSLTQNTSYRYYVRADCGDGTFSAWAGPFLFQTSAPGFTCSAPIVVTSLPYSTTDDTANYGDTIEGNPGANGCGTTNNYLGGNDVVYAYTATFTGALNVNMTPTGTWSGIFVYDNCANIGTTCLAGVANSNTTPRVFDLNVTLGQTYYFVISTWPAPQTTGYTLLLSQLNCPTPINLGVVSVTDTSATLSWQNGTNGTSTSWEVAVVTQGSPVPSSGTSTTNNTSYLEGGLTGSTTYQFYVRADCGDGTFSPWAGPFAFTTAITPPQCGGIFVDNGGTANNYTNGADDTIIICPPTGSGQVVTVTFTSFDTEATWDGLYVFDGDTINDPQIASGNPAGNVPGGLAGSYWGTTIPGPFTSSSADGCLTFRFRSDGSVNRPGWVANVTCAPAPTCPRPNNLTVSAITQNSASISWTEIGTATQWEVLIVPFGSPIPDSSSTGIITNNTTYLATGLNSGTQYTVYVRSVCSSTDISTWTFGKNFTTLIANDECINAVNVPVNPDTNCTQFGSGTLAGATASTQSNTCGGTDDDDVWFSFVATSTSHSIDLYNITGSTTDLYHVVYSGDCNNLTQLSCNDNNNSSISGLTIGNTYYIRVYSWTSTAGQNSAFNICIGTIPPPISTSTTQYTTTQLVEDILLNSTCAIVSNITSSTGSNFGSTNGIGYFNQNGSSFPFAQGIIMTTGNANSAPGPNDTTLGDGNQAWVGDTDLEDIILAATGNAMDSRNASIIEFDFVPIIDTVNFNFIFASEEYGTFQCSYSDAFAFLLTDTTTNTTTNLAVLPSSNTPISVVTIRDQLYNNGCASVNPQYFSTFYGAGGANPIGAPIDFNGVTVPLTAQANVVPGNLYHIKMVIADRLDNNYDSAVFLEGGSFDIGTVDLGNDLLQSTNNALCANETKVLDSGLSPSQFTFTWLFNNDIIPGATGPSITVNQPGIYTLTVNYINTTCTATDNITIEYYPEIVPGTPENIHACSTDGFASFDLTSNSASVLGSLDANEFNLTYYLTNDDAVNETNALTSPFTNTVPFQQTIYVRIERNNTTCYEIRTFDLIVDPSVTPIFNLPAVICQNETAPALPTTSENGIEGTWTPTMINNLQSGTYTFTPNNLTACTVPFEISIEVLERVNPTFLSPAPICNGDVAPTLPTTSTNGITGTWSPNVVSNTQTQTYTFTPDPNQCANPAQMVVTVYDNCSFGSFANAVWLTDCDTNNFFNTVGSGASIIGPAENVFPNADLGTYVSNSGSFKFRGGEVKTFKNNTANVCGVKLYYRIYPLSGTPGAFASMDLNFFEDCSSGSFPSGGPCNPGDQKWQTVLNDSQSPIDLTAFPAGDYKIEVYYDVNGDVNSTTECDDHLLVDNNGMYFVATYTLQTLPTYSSVLPTSCTSNDGSITISGLAPLTSYQLNYTYENSAATPITFVSDANGTYILNGLTTGTYANFLYSFNGCTASSTESITLFIQSTAQLSGTDPLTCNGNNGTITIGNLSPNLTYSVSYTDDTASVGPLSLTSNGNGEIIISGLNAGTYGNFTLSTTNCSATSTETVTLINPNAPVVTVNSETICSGQSATITATPQTPGTYNYSWTVPTGVTNPGNVASFTSNIAGTYTVVITPISTTFCNGSFEDPVGSSSQFPNMINANSIPCWDTTASDNIMEIWPVGGFEGVFAYEGNQFIEMNANSNATTYQNFTTSPGAQLQISFAHRGRQGNDTVGVEIGPVGGPYTSLGNFTDSNSGWVLHNLTYTVPSTGGNNYSLRFVSVSSAGSDISVGNFLDAVSVTSVECSSVPTSGTITILPTVTLNLDTANEQQTICEGSAIASIVYSSANANNITVSGLPSGVTGSFDVNTGTFTISGTTTQAGVFPFVVSTEGGCNIVTLNGTITVTAKVATTFNSITICRNDAVSLPLTSLEGIPGTWTPSTVDNTQTATYNFIPNSGQCALNGSLTVNVTQPTVATFNTFAPICYGDSAVPTLPTTSLEGYTGTWNPDTINNTSSGTYTFTPTAGQCAAPGSVSITVLNDFDFEITGSCVNNNFTLEVSSADQSVDLSTATFQWQNQENQNIGLNSITFNVTEYLSSTTANEEVPITFYVIVTNADGCSKKEAITLEKVFCDIQKGISVNNDGKNDFFDLSMMGVKHLSIFNRYGMKVYAKSNYTTEWKGQSDNGDDLPDGTYYYVIDFNSGPTKTGWIYISREE